MNIQQRNQAGQAQPHHAQWVHPWHGWPRYGKNNEFLITEEDLDKLIRWYEEQAQYFLTQPDELIVAETRKLYHRFDPSMFASDISWLTAYFREKAVESDLDQLKYQAWCDLRDGVKNFTKYRAECGEAYYQQYRNARALVIRYLRKRYSV